MGEEEEAPPGQCPGKHPRQVPGLHWLQLPWPGMDGSQAGALCNPMLACISPGF